jgi:acetyl esterase/lipase
LGCVVADGKRRILAAYNDYKDGYKWLAEEGIKLLNISPNRIAIGGQSAGAMLVAAFAHTQPTPAPRLVVLESPLLAWTGSILPDSDPFYPYYIVTNKQINVMKEFYFGVEGARRASRGLRGSSGLAPLHEDDSSIAKLPPHYISVCELDSLRDQGVEYARE